MLGLLTIYIPRTSHRIGPGAVQYLLNELMYGIMVMLISTISIFFASQGSVRQKNNDKYHLLSSTDI